MKVKQTNGNYSYKWGNVNIILPDKTNGGKMKTILTTDKRSGAIMSAIKYLMAKKPKQYFKINLPNGISIFERTGTGQNCLQYIKKAV